MPAKTVKRESPYLRVGTTIYKRVRQPLSSGRSVETLIPWNVETLRQDYGKSYLACIPKYDGFCTVPDHTNYRREIDGFLNRYEPIPWHLSAHPRLFRSYLRRAGRTGVRLSATALPAPLATAAGIVAGVG
jgi:hypothetical protein